MNFVLTQTYLITIIIMTFIGILSVVLLILFCSCNSEETDENKSLMSKSQRRRFSLIHMDMSPTNSLVRKTQYLNQE
jgi:hypothetical protein